MPKRILQKDNAVLRKKAEPVRKNEFGTKALAALIADMSAALAREKDGVALAAPQIGVSKRVFVVSGKLFQSSASSAPPDDLVFANPRIVSRSKTTASMEEGCLSVRGVFGFVQRSTEISIEAQSADGEPLRLRGRGVLAQIFQHEIDHLEGILFIDKVVNIERITHNMEQ